MDNGVLRDFTRPGHQLAEESLILLAERCFLFIRHSHLVFPIVYPTKRIFNLKRDASLLIYRRLHGKLAAENYASMPRRKEWIKYLSMKQ